jgi:limonene-1,2-epoxide hydrolase
MSRQPPQSSPDNPLYQDWLEGRPGRPKVDRWHHYFDVYHRHLAPFRGQSPTVLEIGVQKGGSLAMWRDYFGAGARIFGLDVDPACAARAPDGARVLIGDQADPNFLARVLAETGAPDIVIDDGGHTARQQINAFDALYPATKLPGVYIVEDTQTAYWDPPHWRDDPQGRTFVTYALSKVHRLYDWSGNGDAFQAFWTRPDQRPPLPASPFCRTTDSIAFYDSMIVFTRRERPEPWRDDR